MCAPLADEQTHDRVVEDGLAARWWPMRAVGVLLILLVRGYQCTLSGWMGGQCRFLPTCSQYMIDAIERHGPLRGLLKGVRRIGRCHPWGGSGYDPA